MLRTPLLLILFSIVIIAGQNAKQAANAKEVAKAKEAAKATSISKIKKHFMAGDYSKCLNETSKLHLIDKPSQHSTDLMYLCQAAIKRKVLKDSYKAKQQSQQQNGNKIKHNKAYADAPRVPAAKGFFNLKPYNKKN